MGGGREGERQWKGGGRERERKRKGGGQEGRTESAKPMPEFNSGVMDEERQDGTYRKIQRSQTATLIRGSEVLRAGE